MMEQGPSHVGVPPCLWAAMQYITYLVVAFASEKITSMCLKYINDFAIG
jgi:hypothetical protein